MRRIKQARIKFISLCPAGANQLPVIYKADDQVELATLSKMDEEAGEIHAVVYAPELRDAQGDIADASVIKEMAYDFAREGGSVDIRHDNKPVEKDRAFVAESFIIQKGDDRFASMTNSRGEQVDVAGGWGVVIKVDDENLRKEYREGKWQGVSMGGQAAFEDETPLDKETLFKHLRDIFTDAQKGTTSAKDDIDMDAAELKKTLEDNNKALVDGVSKAIAEALKPTEKEGEKQPTKKTEQPSKDEAPVFKGDYTDPEALAKFEREVKIHKLKADTDFTDPEAIAKFREQVAEITKADGEQGDPEAERIAALEKELAKLKGTSAPPASNRGNTAPIAKGKDEFRPMVHDGSQISKEDLEAEAAGAAMADIVNERFNLN